MGLTGGNRGNLRRLRRYNRRLLRMLYLSAQVAIRCCPTSRARYDRKRREGKAYKQAGWHCPVVAGVCCGHSSATTALSR
ncbi:hypothetical protein FDZ84_34810 [Saccharopolyspora sp. ASAGF58]|nr:hypothetical protein FDZ84_34810 [Saccharopolyspora sp. ASAGF58]